VKLEQLDGMLAPSSYCKGIGTKGELRFLELGVTDWPMPAPLIETSLPPPGARVPVSRQELERAMAVWLRTMPSHLWKPYLAMLAVDPKRRTEDDRADPRDILASYIAAKFHQVHWEASYEQPGPSAG